MGSTEIRRARAASVADEESLGSRLKSWPDRTKDFLEEVRAEMKKVNYPGRKEVQGTTTVVIITVFIFGLFFYVVDAVLQFGYDHLIRFLHNL